jgi:hypothetical protein
VEEEDPMLRVAAEEEDPMLRVAAEAAEWNQFQNHSVVEAVEEE